MNSWKLPTSLKIGGVDYPIRTDFRDILTILRAFNDPDLPDWAKTQVMLQILYPDHEKIAGPDIKEACEQAVLFIDAGREPEKEDRKRPVLMDWDQDADIIIPAINRVAGTGDVRAMPYLHWWTFLGYYMEIGESLFSNIVQIRQKKAKRKKLEKWEQEFYRENKKLIDIKAKLSEEEEAIRKAEEEAIKELWG